MIAVPARDRAWVIGPRPGAPRGPATTGAAVWLTNMTSSRSGTGSSVGRPGGSRPRPPAYPDFLFPQMTSLELAPEHWVPLFVDNLYMSFTNATAFSPTDVMPMSRWAKLTMLVQSAISLMVVVLVIARAVNILR